MKYAGRRMARGIMEICVVELGGEGAEYGAMYLFMTSDRPRRPAGGFQ